jgi:hypothetical protein
VTRVRIPVGAFCSFNFKFSPSGWDVKVENVTLEESVSDFTLIKTFTWKRLALSILVGSIILETIGFFQFFHAQGKLHAFSDEFVRDTLGLYPGYLLFGNPLFLFLGFFPLQFWLLFEIPSLLCLKSLHNRKNQLSLGKTVIGYTCVVILALIPIFFVHLFGVPEIPFISEKLRISSEASLHTDIFAISPVQMLITYWGIAIWLVSWCYLTILSYQSFASQTTYTNSHPLFILWLLWICFLLLFLVLNPVFFFITLKV